MKFSTIKYGVLLAVYFTYLMLLIKIADAEVNQAIVAAGLFPLGLPLYFAFFRKRSFRRYFLKIAGFVIVFYAVYCIASTLNLNAALRGVSYLGIYVTHIFITIWFLRKKAFTDISSLTLALLIMAVFVVFIPHFAIVGSVKLGAFYNLTSPHLLTETTIEAPLIASLLFLLSMFDISMNRKYTALNIISTLFAAFLLLLFSRRGLIFSSVISLIIYYFYVKTTNRVLLYSSILLLFLPMFWDMISTLLFDLSSNSLFSAIIVRNNASELRTATGRAICWLNVLTLFFTFKSSYIFGFKGGPPEDVFLTTDENGRYENAHNAFLNLFLEAGYLIDILFVLLLIYTFYRYAKLKKFNKNHYILILMFLVSLSATESLIRTIQFGSFVFCFVVIGCFIENDKLELIRDYLKIERHQQMKQNAS